MRHLQNTLLLIGAPSLGAASGGLGLAYFAAITVFRPRAGEDPSLAWGAGLAVIACLVLGGAFGAIAGLVVAIRWVISGDGRSWRAATWIGIALGWAVGLAIRFSVALDEWGVFGDVIQFGPGTATFVVALGTLGGILGSLSTALWTAQHTDTPA